MSLLEGIWVTSFVLAGLSIGTMLLLVLKRLYGDAVGRRVAARREELEGMLIGALDRPQDLAGLSFGRSDKLLLGDISADLSASVRGETLTALVETLERLSIDALYAEAVVSGDVDGRGNAVRVLSLFDNRKSFDALWRALSDPAPDIRLAAARRIVTSGHPFSAAALVETMGVGDVVRHRQLRSILTDLAQADPDGITAALGRSTDTDRRLFLIYALGRSGHYRVVPELIRLAHAEDVNERAEVVRALGALEHPEGEPVILAALDDPAWEVRAQAAQAAAEIGLPKAIDRLDEMLEETQWWVRYRAARALWMMGDEGRARLRARIGGDGDAGRVAELVVAEVEGTPS